MYDTAVLTLAGRDRDEINRLREEEPVAFEVTDFLFSYNIALELNLHTLPIN